MLPPSREALQQHANRSAYQSGYLWGQCVEELDIPLTLNSGDGFLTSPAFFTNPTGPTCNHQKTLKILPGHILAS